MWTNQQPPPEVVQTVDGHSVQLDCRVHGVPTPVVTWSFSKDKKTDFNKIFNGNRTFILAGQLVISPVDAATDQGHYQCEASNGVGNDISAVTALHVHSPPLVQLLGGNGPAVRRGSSTTLRCSVSGDPPLNIQWRKDSVLLDGGTTLGTGQQLSSSELSVADEGLYECAASNAYGDDTDAAFLQVQDVPQPPLDVRVSATGSRRVQLEWKSPVSDGGNPVQEYVIFYQPTDGSSDVIRRVPATLTATIDQLLPATSYHVHVLAANALGQSQPSVGLVVTTDEEAPEGPPVQLGASSVTSRGFTLSWSPPAQHLQNGLIHSYLVTIDSSSGRTLNRTVVSTSGDPTDYVATGLRPNTMYHVYVQAVNSQGAGPPSSPSLSVKTSEDAPEDPPMNVACVALNSQSLQITWQPPQADRRNGIIRGYRVFYELTGDDPAEDQQTTTTTTELTVFLSNLQKFSNYSVQVFSCPSVRQNSN